jgi:uncharacterized integral membrane protein
MNVKLLILLALLAVIGRARVAVLPGWVVPLPALIVAALLIVCATVVAVVALHATRARLVARRPEPAGEVA